MRFQPPAVQGVLNVVIVAAAAATGLYLLHASGLRLLSHVEASSPPVGTQILTQRERWAAHDRTLILAVRRGCHFCEESMPFYRDLASLERSRKLKAHLVAELPDDPVSTRFLLKTQELPIDAVSGVPLNDLSVNGTPTLILVDRTGTVQQVWGGSFQRSKKRTSSRQ